MTLAECRTEHRRLLAASEQLQAWAASLDRAIPDERAALLDQITSHNLALAAYRQHCHSEGHAINLSDVVDVQVPQ